MEARYTIFAIAAAVYMAFAGFGGEAAPARDQSIHLSDITAIADVSSQVHTEPGDSDESDHVTPENESVVMDLSITEPAAEELVVANPTVENAAVAPSAGTESTENSAEIAADETSDALAVQENAEANLEKSEGRVIMPGLMDLSLTNCDVYVSQSVIDNGGAARFDFKGMDIVCGHRHLGFNAMKSAEVGQTHAYIDGVEYVCTAKFIGHNTSTDLTDNDGNVISWTDGIVMYTCNENWQNVTISYWTKV